MSTVGEDARRDGGMERLWTPWRMQYVGGGATEDGCVFCNRLAADDDVASLILHREADVFAIMNLFPYNTGHLMLVPAAHVAGPEEAPEAALARLGTLLAPTLRVLRRVLGCHGFNVGLNVGAVAGAGVAEHLHQHVVPRWTGDANFMPILASTMVLPELIPVTYAKLRAEFQRELHIDDLSDRDVARVVTLVGNDGVVVVESGDGPRLPSARAAEAESLWRAAMRAMEPIPGTKEITGWAGPTRADAAGPTGLMVRALDQDADLPSTMWVVPVGEAMAVLVDGEDRSVVGWALGRSET